MERILVYGDSMLDIYTFGNVSKISPEAPVLEFVETKRKVRKLGAAANIAVNLGNLGMDVTLLTGLGDDLEAYQFSNLLDSIRHEKQINVKLETIPISRTTVKERLIDEKFNQHILRKAREDTTQKLIGIELEEYLLKFSKEIQFDKIFISDYDKGMVSPNTIDMIQDTFSELPFIVDPKVKNFNFYRGIDVMTPNHYEVAAVLRVQPEKVLENPLDYGIELQSALDIKNLIITLGKRGIALLSDTLCTVIPAIEREVFDITGAGDCFAAVTAYLLKHCSIVECVSIANIISGLAVKKFGNYIVTKDDVTEAAAKLNITINI